MAPLIASGDTIIVNEQPDAEDGEVVVFTVEHSEGCVKRLKKYSNYIAMMPDNDRYEPLLFTKSQVESIPVCIVGKVIEVRHKL